VKTSGTQKVLKVQKDVLWLAVFTAPPVRSKASRGAHLTWNTREILERINQAEELMLSMGLGQGKTP